MRRFVGSISIICLAVSVSYLPSDIIPNIDTPTTCNVRLDFIRHTIGLVVTSGGMEVTSVTRVGPAFSVSTHDYGITTHLLTAVVRRRLLLMWVGQCEVGVL